MEVDQLKELIKLRFKGCSSRKISTEIGVSESHVDRALAFLSYHGPYVLLTHPSLRDNSRSLTSEDYTLMAEYALKNKLSYDRTSSLFMASRKIVTRYIQGRKLFDAPFSEKDPPFPPNVSLDRAYDPMHPNYNPELTKAVEDTLVYEFGLSHEDLIPVVKPISARAAKRAAAAASSTVAPAVPTACNAEEAVPSYTESAPSNSTRALSEATSSSSRVPDASASAATALETEELYRTTASQDPQHESCFATEPSLEEAQAMKSSQSSTACESMPSASSTEHCTTVEAKSTATADDNEDFDFDDIPIFAAASANPTDLVAAIESASAEQHDANNAAPIPDTTTASETVATASETASSDTNEPKDNNPDPDTTDELQNFRLGETKGQTTLFDLDM